MPLILDLPKNHDLNTPRIVQTTKNYDVKKDENVTGLTTLSGNWIKRNHIIYDFLNNKGLKAKVFVIPAEKTFYVDHYGEPHESFIPEKRWSDDIVHITGWITWWSSDEAYYTYNAKIPWKDLQTLIGFNEYDENNLVLESIEFIPEIKVLNNPLGAAHLTFEEIKIKMNNNEFDEGNHKIGLEIPEEFRWSNWDASSIFSAILDVLDFGSLLFPATKFIKMADVTRKSLDIGSNIYSSVSYVTNKVLDGMALSDNYAFVDPENNTLKIKVNKKIDQGSDIEINVDKIIFEGWKPPAFADDMTSKLNKIFLKLNFKQGN
ncbi:hypothetical protein ACW95P_02430 [Candidatus Mycoplasma pogonae]